MKRIHMHWTGGNTTPNDHDMKCYHFVVDGAGAVKDGHLRPEANLSTSDGAYVAHTKGANTGAIGIAMAGMFNAVERPFNKGDYPINLEQLKGFVSLAADLCMTYDIKVTRKTVLTHAEVQKELGVQQNAKWDITWLPMMEEPSDPTMVGDSLRLMIQDRIDAITHKAKTVNFTPRRTTIAQSSTAQALSVSTISTLAGASDQAKLIVGNVTETFGVSPQFVFVMLALAGIAWAFRERIKRWAAGDR